MNMKHLDPESLSVSLPSFSDSTSPPKEMQENGRAVLRNIAVGYESRLLNRPATPTISFPQQVPARGRHVPAASSVLSDPLKHPTADGGQQALVTIAEKVPPDNTRSGVDESEAVSKHEHEAACQSGYQEGFELGLREGRHAGITEGRNAARQELEKEIRAVKESAAARLTQLDQLLAAFPAQIRQSLEAAEDDMVALCHEVICRILGEQMKARDGIANGVRQAVRTAASSSMVKGIVRIHVHPHDVALLQEDEGLADWLRQQCETNSGVRWVADEQVQIGGCVIHTAEGTLDARLDTQLAALRQLLLQHKSSTVTAVSPAMGARAQSGKVVHAQQESSI